jgi:hypothetical protein
MLHVAAMIGLFAISVFAQTDVFSDPNAEYTFAIPEAKWKMTTKPTAALSNADFVYGDRADGLLEIRKLTVPRDQILSDMIHGAEEAKLSFRPGFVAGRDENFSGRMRGTVYNFEYVAAGRNMAGRNYYLRANETTVYLLKFSGPKDNVRSLRSQADTIARTFTTK